MQGWRRDVTRRRSKDEQQNCIRNLQCPSARLSIATGPGCSTTAILALTGREGATYWLLSRARACRQPVLAHRPDQFVQAQLFEFFCKWNPYWNCLENDIVTEATADGQSSAFSSWFGMKPHGAVIGSETTRHACFA
ncbi:hypothetical protein IF2G_00078 [Cordyceps javanica]|nr:hypothetical protein IF2G_00078 [Cordyceps javanica]